MTDRPNPLTDDEIAVLAALAAEGDGRGLDDELIAALAEGVLPPDQQAAAERRLLTSDESRARLVDAGTTQPTTESAPRPVASEGWETAPRSSRPLLGLAIAAALMLTVSAAVYAAAVGARARGGSDAALLRAAATLRTSEPDLFADFSPLDAAARAGGVAPVERSALRVLRPAPVVLSRRPQVEWTALPGADTYALRIRDESGTAIVVASPTATSLRAPAELVRGADYVVEVSAEGALGPVTARRAFRVATVEEEASFESQQQAIGRLAQPDVQNLLTAHLALREGLLVEAERALMLHLYAYPHDSVARETLGHTHRRLGITGD